MVTLRAVWVHQTPTLCRSCAQWCTIPGDSMRLPHVSSMMPPAIQGIVPCP